MFDHIKKIKLETARKYALTVSEIESKSRSRMLVIARTEAIGRCREETECSLKEIAHFFGRRDHTTILHLNRRYKELKAAGRL